MYEKIPLELKQLPHWVGWKYMQRPGEDHKRKVPINAMDGQPAKSNDPTTWCDFDTACLGKERFGLDGIGFMFSGDGIFGIDIDHCYDPEAQELDPAAAEIIETVQSYTELSPSGTGIHILCKGVLPEGRKRRGAVEMYSTMRYFTVTGNQLAWSTLSRLYRACRGDAPEIPRGRRNRHRSAKSSAPNACRPGHQCRYVG